MASYGLPATIPTSSLPTITTTTTTTTTTTPDQGHIEQSPETPTTATTSTSSIGAGASTKDVVRGPARLREDVIHRRPSIQFVSGNTEPGWPTGSPKQRAVGGDPIPRRIASPPPPKAFQNRVSFDTFDNKDARDFSLSLSCKHRDYQYTRRSRTFLCGTDQNDYSEFALEWLIDELVDDGDEIVCLRVVEKDSKISSESSIEDGRYRREAQKLLDQIIEKNADDRAISLVLEFAVGKVHETIQRMISVYEPAILIVGTRGRSLGGIQGLLPGSVSKYCLQHSPVPVIVVRPTSKREKKKRKRQMDPTRKGYLEIVSRTGVDTALAGSNRSSMTEETLVAPQVEAEAVAAALGLPPDLSYSADSAMSPKAERVGSSNVTTPEGVSPSEEVLPGDPRSPTGVVVQSPTTTDSAPSEDGDDDYDDEDDEDDDDNDDGDDDDFGNRTSTEREKLADPRGDGASIAETSAASEQEQPKTGFGGPPST